MWVCVCLHACGFVCLCVCSFMCVFYHRVAVPSQPTLSLIDFLRPYQAAVSICVIVQGVRACVRAYRCACVCFLYARIRP